MKILVCLCVNRELLDTRNVTSEQEKSFVKSDDICSWRYLIYIESYGWSASLKYRLACGSVLLQGGFYILIYTERGQASITPPPLQLRSASGWIFYLTEIYGWGTSLEYRFVCGSVSSRVVFYTIQINADEPLALVIAMPADLACSRVGYCCSVLHDCPP